MARQIRKYSIEFKQEAVNLALKSRSMSTTAQELGIPVATLHSWIKRLQKKLKPENEPVNGGKEISTLIEENRRLMKEVAILKEEREILKKAATYFAQHQK